MNNIKIDWVDALPYNHSWTANLDSIMDPGEKITWPQLIAEYVVFLRTKFLKAYSNVKTGNGWWKPIERDVRKLNQQSAAICNYFPHPKDEALIVPVFRNYFRSMRVLKIGQFRKTRSKINKKTGRMNCLITQDEKDVVAGLMAELNRAIETRNSYTKIKIDKPIIIDNMPAAVIQPKIKTPQKGSLSYLMEIEKGLKQTPSPVDKEETKDN